MKVTLLVDETGDIVGVCDAATGASVAHDVQRVQAATADLHASVHVAYMPARVDPRVQRALNYAVTQGHAARVVPLPHCAFDGRSLRGCAYIMPPDEPPSATGFPLDLRYATGVSIIELERRLPNGSYMSAEFVRSGEFEARNRAALEALRVGRGTPPGLVSPGTRALEALRGVTSAAYPADPLLRVFRPDPLRSWQPHLRQNDFLRVCCSQWDAAQPRMAAAFGHAPGDTHFYVVLCWHLPEEVADQLLQLARLNPDTQSWAQLAGREEFARALRLSVQAREHMLRRYLELTAMEPKQSDKRFTHTTSDILVPAVDTEQGAAPVFYSGCAPTDGKPDGVISLSKNDPDGVIYWWAGPYTPDHPGGMAWEMPGAAHAMPTVGTSLAWTKSVLGTLAEAGHNIENGYIKLTPLI